jgi:O-antigen/teichoic acid export membrane protein
MSLVRQTSIYFVANIASAIFGLVNVVLFTRLLNPADYGIYILGSGFANIVGALLYTGLKQAVLRQEARADGTDIRGTVLLGFFTSAVTFPVIYLVGGRFFSLDVLAITGVLALALAVGFFELGQELARAHLRAVQFMRATIIRAIFVSLFGVGVALAGGGGPALLISSAGAYLASAGLALRGVWAGTKLTLRDPKLRPLLLWGLPFTVSITVLSLSNVMDRFIVAWFLGEGAAGEYGAAVDLVRQALIIPAISASSAFVPMAVRILANEGVEATHRHLNECLELLVAVALPSCVGFALIAPHIADLILGAAFRDTAHVVMPIVAIAVIFQIILHQYLHISFMLANRNAFYIVNTLATLAFNLVAAVLLVSSFGQIGAAWSRLAAEAFGVLNAVFLARRAFVMPVPWLRLARVGGAVAAMALAVIGLDRLGGDGGKLMLGLVIAGGAVAYVATCWGFDVAHMRARTASLLERLGQRANAR